MESERFLGISFVENAHGRMIQRDRCVSERTRDVSTGRPRWLKGCMDTEMESVVEGILLFFRMHYERRILRLNTGEVELNAFNDLLGEHRKLYGSYFLFVHLKHISCDYFFHI